jgi:pentapeptide MXKDX repeat protein
MRRTLRTLALLLLGLIVLPTFAADDKKPDADKKDEVKKDDVKKDDVKKDDVKKDDVKKDDVKKDDVKKDDVKKADPKKDDPKKDDPKKDDPKKDDPKKDDPKKDDKKPDPKKDLDKKDPNLLKAGTLTGKIMLVDEPKKSLQIEYDVPKLNPNAVLALNNATVNLQTASARGDYNGVRAAQLEIAKQKAAMYTMTPMKIDLVTTEDVVVRLATPRPEFDEKGKLKKHTAKELKELRGDSKLPGFAGEFSDLKTNLYVTLSLVRKKDAPRPKPGPKSKDADAELMQENKPMISQIMVLGEPKTGP